MLTILLSRISLHSWLWWRPWQGSVDRTRWHARLCRGYMISLCHWRPLWCHRRPMWRHRRTLWRHRRTLWRHRRALHSNKERPWWSTNLRWKSSRGWRGTWVVRWGLGNCRLGLHAPWKLRWIRGGRWTSRERGGMGDGKRWSWERGLCWRKWASVWLGGTWRYLGCGKTRLRERRSLCEGLWRNRWWSMRLSEASGGERWDSIWERLLGRWWSSVVWLRRSLSYSFSRRRLWGSSGSGWESRRSCRRVGSRHSSLGHRRRG